MAIIYKNGIAYGNQRALDATLTHQGEAADAKAVGDALALKAGTGVIADDFSTSQSYAIGDYTYYNGSLYRFTAAHSAGAWVGTDAQAVQLAEDVVDLKNTLSVLDDEIPDTVQTITFDQSGNVQSITHSRNNTAIRTDVFTFTANSVTEVRTLSTGQSLTIVTNLSTLETTITYSEGGN